MSSFRLKFAMLNNRYVLAALGALVVAGLVLLFRGTPLRAQSVAYLHPADPTINVGERVSIGAYDVPKGQTAYVRMTGPIKPEGRCGASVRSQPRAPQPSTGSGYYDSLWVEGCSQGTGHLRLETQDGSTVFARMTVIVRGPPGTVTGLDVIPGSRKLTLRWAKPTNNGGAALTGYQVQNNQATPGWPGGSSIIENPDTTSFKVEPLLPDTTYQVRVRACNAASLCSNWVYGSGHVPAETTAPTPTPTPTATPTSTEHTAPGTVRDLTVMPGDGSLRLTWRIPSNTGTRPITGYHVQNNEGTLGWPEGVSVIDSSDHSDIADKENLTFTIEPLINNRTYRVRVQACNGNCGDWVERSGRPVPPGTTTVMAPDPVMRLRVTPGAQGTSLDVEWDAPSSDGGSAITRYEIQYKEAASTSATWLSAPNVTSTQTEITGLTSGTTYEVRVRACNSHNNMTLCGEWRSTNDPIVEQITLSSLGTDVAKLGNLCTSVPAAPSSSSATTLDQPTNLEVIPYPQRKAVLVWDAVAGATDYVVQVREFGGVAQVWQNSPRANAAKPCHVINLDEVMTVSGSAKGLADVEAFEFRVQATWGSGNNKVTSPVSQRVIIIDTPITEADGDSRGETSGKAVVTWTRVDDVRKLGSGYANGMYVLRYRRAAGSHSSPGWQPGTYVDDEVTDPPVSTNTGTISPRVNPLVKRAIYAIQLIYEVEITAGSGGTAGIVPEKIRVYAARDVYVWPSDVPPTAGSRVATFPLTTRLENKTFKYRICDETFNVEDDISKGRKDDWIALINHAFEQWSVATGGEVTAIREQYTEEEVASDPALKGKYKPCANYADLIEKIKGRIQSSTGGTSMFSPSLPPMTLINNIKNYILTLKNDKLLDFGEFDKNDREGDEILMFNDSSGLFNVVGQQVFGGIASDVGNRRGCWYKPDPTALGGYRYEPALMCTDTVKLTTIDSAGNPLSTELDIDIIIRRKPFMSESLAVPASDARFNACPNSDSAYPAFLHEVGHALGIAGGDAVDKLNVRWDSEGHPNGVVSDSMMAQYLRIYCSPHPFDIMAIYALYQTR